MQHVVVVLCSDPCCASVPSVLEKACLPHLNEGQHVHTIKTHCFLHLEMETRVHGAPSGSSTETWEAANNYIVGKLWDLSNKSATVHLHLQTRMAQSVFLRYAAARLFPECAATLDMGPVKPIGDDAPRNISPASKAGTFEKLVKDKMICNPELFKAAIQGALAETDDESFFDSADWARKITVYRGLKLQVPDRWDTIMRCEGTQGSALAPFRCPLRRKTQEQLLQVPVLEVKPDDASDGVWHMVPYMVVELACVAKVRCFVVGDVCELPNPGDAPYNGRTARPGYMLSSLYTIRTLPLGWTFAFDLDSIMGGRIAFSTMKCRLASSQQQDAAAPASGAAGSADSVFWADIGQYNVVDLVFVDSPKDMYTETLDRVLHGGAHDDDA